LYAAWPLGGALQARTLEAKGNAYFDLRALPDGVTWEWLLFDAVSDDRPMPRIIETPSGELRQVKRKLARRWVKNLLMLRPEPRFPRFHVTAVGLVWDESHLRVMTITGKDGDSLPRVDCDGKQAPWAALTNFVRQHCGIQPTFQWVGLWQDTQKGAVELIFAATMEEAELSVNADWSMARTVPLDGLDAEYVERVKASYMSDPAWSIQALPEILTDDGTIHVNEGKSHGIG
jgi:hypothetical protein